MDIFQWINNKYTYTNVSINKRISLFTNTEKSEDISFVLNNIYFIFAVK